MVVVSERNYSLSKVAYTILNKKEKITIKLVNMSLSFNFKN